ncbi:MAG: hypothetical protein HYY01_09965 [Chloroflexi bacterium]|nr:hypothetical protein [Chloroflexota bacterium]
MERLSARTQQAFEELELNVVLSCLAATKKVCQAWPELSGGKPASSKEDWVIRSEMLFFLLHMVNRLAFQSGGSQVMASLQDWVIPRAVRRLVTTSWDRSQAKPGSESLLWKMVNDAIEDLNDAEEEYASCKAFGLEEGKPGVFNNDSLLGRLGHRVERNLGINPDPTLRARLMDTAVDAFVSTKRCVDTALKALTNV